MTAPTPEQRAEWRALSSVTTGNSVLAVLDRRILALLNALDAAERDQDIVRHAATIAAITPCSCSAQRARAETAEAQVAQVAADALEIDRERMEAEARVERVRDLAARIEAGELIRCCIASADYINAALAEPATAADFARGWFDALTEAQDIRERQVDDADDARADQDWGSEG